MPALHKQSLNWQDRFSGHVTDVELCRQIDLCTVGQSSIVERGRHLGYREHLLGTYVRYSLFFFSLILVLTVEGLLTHFLQFCPFDLLKSNAQQPSDLCGYNNRWLGPCLFNI